MKPHPKTGERRLIRQPFKIDRLPQSFRDELVRLREKEGLSWMQIERLSPKLFHWKLVSPRVTALFPGRRIPHTNLARWYDVKVEQAPSPEKQAIAVAELTAEILFPRIKALFREELKRRKGC